MNAPYVVIGFFLLIGLLVSRMEQERRQETAKTGRSKVQEFTPAEKAIG